MLGGNADDLDHRLSASVKKILLENIIFKEATKPDPGELLNRKYKPLNSGYNRQGLTQKSNSGLNIQADIPKPSIILYNEESIINQWKQMKGIGPGLANLGNTCFLNSVLQVLTYTPPLVNYIFKQEHKAKCKSMGFCMQCELTNHVLRASRGNSQGAIRPISIIQKLSSISRNFKFGRQEDAHEFLRYVIEGIQKSDIAGLPKLDKISKETTVANAIFGGYYRSQVKCLHCQHESNTFDPMMDINLDIKECGNILQALQKSVRPDRLDGDNKYFCDRCRSKRVAQKRGTVHKEPNVLTLQLKRFDFTKSFGGKISRDIAFPEDLNIRPYMSHPQGDPVIYSLYAVLVHSGYSCNSGHYYCYVKAPNGLWYEMNDNRVCQVGFQTVKNAQAYLLFYVKKTRKQKQAKPPVEQQTKSPVGPLKFTVTNPKVSHTQTTADAIGTSVQRKPEPKINWNNTSAPLQRPVNEKSSKVEGLLKEKADKLSAGMNSGGYASHPVKINRDNLRSVLQQPGTSTVNDDKVKISTDNQSKTIRKETKSESSIGKLSSEKKSKSNGNKKKDISLNSLERLSLSYAEDTDSRSSSASTSPRDTTVVTPNDSNHFDVETNKETSSGNDCQFSNNNHNKTKLNLSLSKETTHSKMSPIRLKLNHGKYFPNSNSKFSVWSPVTKGALHPRVIVHKHLNENKNGKDNIKSPTRTVKNISPTTETRQSNSTNEKLIGPIRSPSKQHRMDSTTAENSSADNSDSNSIRNSSATNVESLIGEESRKRKLSTNAYSFNNAENYFEVSTVGSSQGNDDDDDVGGSPKKKKKKKKKRHSDDNNVLHSTLVLSPVNKRVEDKESSRDENKKKKKKKKKRKHKHKQSDNEDNSDEINTSFSTVDIKKTLEQYKENIDTTKHKKHSKHKKHRNHSDSSDDSIIHNKKRSKHSHGSSSDVDKENLKDKKTRKHSKHRHRHDSNSDSNSSSKVHEKKSKKHKTSRPVSPDSSNEDDNKHHISKDKCLKKDVPCHSWDDEKKRVTTWDGSQKTHVLDYLNETKVSSWGHTENTANLLELYSMKNRDGCEQVQDDYDEEYDQGKVKKTGKTKHYEENDDDDGEYGGKRKALNPFQHLQDYRTYSGDKQASHRPPSMSSSKHRHHKHHHHKVKTNNQ